MVKWYESFKLMSLTLGSKVPSDQRQPSGFRWMVSPKQEMGPGVGMFGGVVLQASVFISSVFFSKALFFVLRVIVRIFIAITLFRVKT